jgi:predicted O-methyltransferase YrrM
MLRNQDWQEIWKGALTCLSSEFMRDLAAARARITSRSAMGLMDAALLYALVKFQRSRTIIEVGSGFGMSTAILRRAQMDIPLPRSSVVTIARHPEPTTGCLVPDDLRSGVIQVFGDVRQIVADPIIPKQCDLYLHDSTHTWSHQSWEYRTFWDRLCAGGMLVSHDIKASAAFPDFVSRLTTHGTNGMTTRENCHYADWGCMNNVGFVVKTADAPRSVPRLMKELPNHEHE